MIKSLYSVISKISSFGEQYSVKWTCFSYIVSISQTMMQPMNMITMTIKITVSFQCILEAILYSHLRPEMFLYNTCLTYFQGILLTLLVSIWIFENAKAAYKVINCKDAACNTVLSLVSVLGSEEDCPLAECLVFLEPQPKMGAIRGFSSSGWVNILFIFSLVCP